MTKLLVKLPNWMGDILFSMDLLYTLSAQFDRVALCTSEQQAELFEIFPLPNAEVIAYPPENWPQLDRETIRRIQDFRPDVTLLLPNSFGSALVFRLAGISGLAGFDTEHRRLLLSKWIDPPLSRVHQNNYYLELLKLFGVPAAPYPVPQNGNRERLVVIHPGASKMERAWGLDRFAKLAEQLSSDGYEVLFVAGEQISVPFPRMVRPSLTKFVEVLKKCSLFIGNDSGPLHLAQQSGARVLGIYGPGDPLTTGPRPITQHRIVYHGFPCSPCRQRYFRDCNPAPSGKPFCVETISTAEVAHAAAELLDI